LLISEFQKNDNEKVRVEISSFQGKQYLNFRIWFKGDDGDFHPSKKGITISTDLVDELKKSIDKAASKVFESLPDA